MALRREITQKHVSQSPVSHFKRATYLLRMIWFETCRWIQTRVNVLVWNMRNGTPRDTKFKPFILRQSKTDNPEFLVGSCPERTPTQWHANRDSCHDWSNSNVSLVISQNHQCPANPLHPRVHSVIANKRDGRSPPSGPDGKAIITHAIQFNRHNAPTVHPLSLC